MGETRSEKPARSWAQLDLLDSESDSHVVGVRQGESDSQPRGGGYLDECSTSEVTHRAGGKNFADLPPEDVRNAQLLAELDAMGLPRVMLTMAQELGFDAFMRCWQIWDSAPEVLSDNGYTIMLRMPRLKAYQRYQRNRFVETLASMGLPQREIRSKVKAQLGEILSDRHTRRLMASRRVKV